MHVHYVWSWTAIVKLQKHIWILRNPPEIFPCWFVWKWGSPNTNGLSPGLIFVPMKNARNSEYQLFWQVSHCQSAHRPVRNFGVKAWGVSGFSQGFFKPNGFSLQLKPASEFISECLVTVWFRTISVQHTLQTSDSPWLWDHLRSLLETRVRYSPGSRKWKWNKRWKWSHQAQKTIWCLR